MTGPETLLGGGMVIGLLAALWRNIQSAARRLVSLILVQDQINEDLAKAVLILLNARCRRSPFDNRFYRMGWFYILPLKRAGAVVCEEWRFGSRVYWWGWFPLVFSSERSGKASDSESSPNVMSNKGSSSSSLIPNYYKVTYLRGTWDSDTLFRESSELVDRENHKGGLGQNRRLFTRQLVGSLDQQRLRQKGVKNSDSDSPESDPVSDSGSGAPPQSMNHWDHGCYRFLGYDAEDIGNPLRSIQPLLPSLALSVESQRVVDEIRQWTQSREWYESRQISYRRSYLFYGAGGTGKTALARACGHDFDLPIFIFQLGTMTDRNFIQTWKWMLQSVPCIVLFEDIDTVFDGRISRNEQIGGLSFECLLNCLCGIDPAEGVIMIVTTNHPETLDDALGQPTADGFTTRPGRIDRAVWFGPLSEEGRGLVARRILGDVPHLIPGVVQAGEGETGAQYQERCTRVALEQFWNQGCTLSHAHGVGVRTGEG